MLASIAVMHSLIVFVDKDPIHVPLSLTREDVREVSAKLCEYTKLARKMDMKKFGGVPLPLHAAAPFRKGQKSVWTSTIYLTTTLTALIRSRQPGSPDSATGKRRFIAIGQAAKDAGKRVSVSAELGRLVDGHTAFTCIEGEESSISNVTEELGKHDWVHFACHGIPNRERPFESGFALHDGRFAVQHIIQCDLENPGFTCLSACHTTVGDRERLDEVIRLASAMQFAGFRSVIGTMWAVDVAETNQITSTFYKQLGASGSYTCSVVDSH